VIQTVQTVFTFYLMWLAYIKYGGTSQQALFVLDGVESSPALIAIFSLKDLLGTFRLAIADSIMVGSTSLSAGLVSKFHPKVWRCWIVWDRSYKTALLSLLTNIGSIGAYPSQPT
jgi:hypothetical protein